MSTSRAPILAIIGGLACIVAFSGCASSAASTPSGAELFESCVPCHGEKGEGNQSLGAPAIAGLPAWYVTAQLEHFQSGLRGQHADDTEGLRMQAMARQMKTDMERAAVASHVASLPRVVSPAAIHAGDPTAVQALYVTCSTCHGMKGEGNEAVKAPPLAGMDDWYIAAQITKFKEGVRGSAQGDAFGTVMRTIVAPLTPELANQMAAYVHALPR
jgi:cytochrome c553